MPYRLIVTGGRRYTDADTLRAVLDRALARRPDLHLVLGDCPTGADAGAWWWAVERGVPHERHIAHWRRYGDAAGPRRNAAMVASGADALISFPGRYGTADCTQRAVNAGIRVGAVSDGTRQRRIGLEPGQVVWW